MFHRYVQRDINRSHLLHKANSVGTVQRTRGEHGDKEDTYCTLSSNTPVLPLTERGMVGETERDGGREGTRAAEGRGGGWDLDSYSNTKEHVQIV